MIFDRLKQRGDEGAQRYDGDNFAFKFWPSQVGSKRNIPTVFITTHGNETARSQALEDAAVDYLFKPFSEQALLNAINEALRGRAKAKGGSHSRDLGERGS